MSSIPTVPTPDPVIAVRRSRRRWTVSEDALLRSLVLQHGARKWSAIAACIPGRTGKSTRQRWINSVDPHKNPPEWTRDEDRRLVLLQRLHRVPFENGWNLVSREIPGRTEIHVKNRSEVIARLKTESGSYADSLVGTEHWEVSDGEVAVPQQGEIRNGLENERTVERCSEVGRSALFNGLDGKFYPGQQSEKHQMNYLLAPLEAEQRVTLRTSCGSNFDCGPHQEQRIDVRKRTAQKVATPRRGIRVMDLLS